MEGNINEAIEQIADKVGLAISDVNQLLPQVVKLEIATQSIKIGIFALCLILGIALIISAIIKYKKDNDMEYDETPEVLVIFGLFICIIGVVFLASSIGELLRWIIAPNASFIEYIINIAKGF